MLNVCRCNLRNRCFSALSAEQQAAAMLSTVHRALRLCGWQQQQQQQQDVCSNNFGEDPLQQCRRTAHVFLPSVQLLTECVLLVPTADMASSCLQLITPLMQQVNAALQLARDEGDGSELTVLHEGIYKASFSALVNLGPAVCHCGKQTTKLKQRRQLLRLWADAVAVLMQGEQAVLMQANTGKRKRHRWLAIPCCCISC
jgi:hypothetical protein